MNRKDREQVDIFERYLMRVDWHLLVARYSEAEIKRWIQLGDLALKREEDEAERGDEHDAVPLKAA